MDRFLLVFLGSGVGGGLRYAIGLWAGPRLGPGFPYGTLIVNLLGCFLLALIAQLAVHVSGFPANLRLALTTGVMGGLTTYSTFNYETQTLVGDGAARTAALYLAVTVLGGLAAGFLGLLLGRRLAGA